MKKESKLTTEFITKQILIEENSRGDASHVTLMGDDKGKKPSQGSSTDSDAKKKNMKCHYCKKKRHVKSECRKLKANQVAGTVSENKRVEGSKTQTAKVTATTEESVIHLFMARKVTSDLASRWIIDLGATSLITSRKEWFINYSLFRTPISIGLDDDSIIKAVGSGSVRISITVDGTSRLFELQDVYYVPDMGTNNLLSVTYMVQKGYTVNFGTNMCEISKAGSVIGKAENRKELWVLDGNPVVPDSYVAHVAKASLSVCHKRLEHAMTRSIKKLLESSMVTGMELIDDGTNHADGECIACIKEKTTQNMIPKKSNMENPRRLHRIYSNVCGPFDIKGYSQSQFFVMFVDGFLHYVRVKPIRSKDEASKVLKEWITCSKIETGEKANLLRTDGGGEYMGMEFQEWLRSREMHHEVTNANTPQENGVAECLNRTILEMMRTIMHKSDLPKNLWPFAAQYTQEIVNRLPT